jgi:hypothetical protein
VLSFVTRTRAAERMSRSFVTLAVPQVAVGQAAGGNTDCGYDIVRKCGNENKVLWGPVCTPCVNPG